jgi:hypothetical protein
MIKPESVWMLVSHDEYELPLKIAEDARGLSKQMGISVNAVRSRQSQHKTYKQPTLLHVWIDEEEDAEDILPMPKTGKYKNGDLAYICRDCGIAGAEGRKVSVLSTSVPGIHSVKVQDIKTGTIYYVQPDDLAKRKTKALKKEPAALVTDEMKINAEKAADRKIARFKMEKDLKETKNLPKFSDIKKKFYAVGCLINAVEDEECALTMTERNKEHSQLLISLAEEALFAEIKNGVINE